MTFCNRSTDNRGTISPRRLFTGLLLALLGPAIARGDELFIRASQAGYWINETKAAIVFSKSPVPEEFTVVSERAEGNVFFTGKARPITNAVWGQFSHHAELDFTTLHTPGRYILKIGNAKSLPVQIGDRPCGKLAADLLEFMRQQRCGYNP